MVSFARAKTRSMLSKLWPVSSQSMNDQVIKLDKPNVNVENILEQNRSFFAASKNGGMWFS